MSFDLLQFRKSGLILPSLWQVLFDFSFPFRSSLFIGTPRLNSVHGLYYGVVFTYFYDNGLLFCFRPFGSHGYTGWKEFSRFVFSRCYTVFSGELVGSIDYKVGSVFHKGEPFSLSISSTFISVLSLKLHQLSVERGSDCEVFLVVHSASVKRENLSSALGGSRGFRDSDRVILKLIDSKYIWHQFFKGSEFGGYEVVKYPCWRFGYMDLVLLVFSYSEGYDKFYMILSPYSELDFTSFFELVKLLPNMRFGKGRYSVDLFYFDVKGGVVVSKGERKVSFSDCEDMVNELNRRVAEIRQQVGSSFYRLCGVRFSCPSFSFFSLVGKTPLF